MPLLCRDCLAIDPAAEGRPCPSCGSVRVAFHPELFGLAIAHIDCDAFYATVEKRDRPDLRDNPVLVGGGGARGVVMAACYVARRFGCRSAMPMARALRLCPQAMVVPPDMAKYQRVGREVRALMQAVTPLVEPLSVDEAFLDLSGTERLHHGPPARTLAQLAQRIEEEIGITVTVGLSHNKFLAKLASGIDKPRGFTVIGRAETVEFLAGRPVGDLWGVGEALQRRLAADGIRRIGELRRHSEAALVARYGAIGRRLARFAVGEDDRRVTPGGDRKSVSAETTFDRDLTATAALGERLWPLCEEVAGRLKADCIAGTTVTLKLKTADFRIVTRRRSLAHPTQLADTIWRTASALLESEADGMPYRLIGVGLSGLGPDDDADPPDLADPDGQRRKAVERAVDGLRARFGHASIVRGRGFDSGGRR
jgi:DNA polymerase-4